MFGFGTSPDLTTPIGAVIKTATDSLRISPDWTQYMNICDQINSNPRINAPHAAKAIRRRLLDSDQQVLALTLTLLETCMKNCGNTMAACFDKPLMDEVVNITKGSKGLKNSEDALRLIQQWGRVYEDKRNFPIFFDTYMTLKTRGVNFPKEDTDSLATYNDTPSKQRSVSREVGLPQPPHASPQATRKPSADGARAPPAPPAPLIDPNEKLLQDLGVVMEKVKLCREMLPISPGIERDEALAEVIGFLEACRDRMIDLIEAASCGELNEVVFEEVLKVNDSILKTLDAERTGMPINVDEESNPMKAPEKAPDNFFADFDNNFPSSATKAPAKPSSSTAAPATDNLLDIETVTPQVNESWSKTHLSKVEEELFGKPLGNGQPTSTTTPVTSGIPLVTTNKDEEDFFAMLEKS